MFDSGGYSEANVKSYNDAKIKWISRVPETTTVAKTAVQQEPEEWQTLSDGSGTMWDGSWTFLKEKSEG